MKQKLKMIWRILRDRQVVVITEDHGKCTIIGELEVYQTYFKCVTRCVKWLL